MLQKDDVILSIAGSPIGNDGTIPFRDGGERVSFRFAILSKFEGESVAMQILRNREIQEIDVKVMKPGMLAAIPANQYLFFYLPLFFSFSLFFHLSFTLSHHRYDVVPSYFIYAGMVFQVLTQPYLSLLVSL